MVNVIKNFVWNIFFFFLFEKRNVVYCGSKEYFYVENQEDSGEDDIVYLSEEMIRSS